MPSAAGARTPVAKIVFNLVEFNDSGDADASGNAKYFECQFTSPPLDFGPGIGMTLAEAFANLQARMVDSAILAVAGIYPPPTSGGEGGSTAEPGP